MAKKVLAALDLTSIAFVNPVKNQRETWPFTYAGTLVAGTGTFKMANRSGVTKTIHGVWASAGTAPTGAAVLVDVNKNGTTIFTTQGNRPSIAISGVVSTLAVPDVVTIADGDYFTVDIDQIGSTVAGADLTVGVVVSG